MNDYPFTEKLIKDNVFLREFKEDTNESELVWHQDQEERILTVVKSNNWKLQMTMSFLSHSKKVKNIQFLLIFIIALSKAKAI